MNLIELIEKLNIILTPNSNVLEGKKYLIKYDADDWKKYIKETDFYEKNLIYRNDIYEIFLISWNKDSKTKFHNHPKNGCLLKILEGTLIESYSISSNITELNPNDISHINHNMYHSITSINNSYSLHIYSPPLYYN